MAANICKGPVVMVKGYTCGYGSHGHSLMKVDFNDGRRGGARIFWKPLISLHKFMKISAALDIAPHCDYYKIVVLASARVNQIASIPLCICLLLKG